MSGRCIQRGRTVRDRELRRLLIGAPGVVQSTLRDANVGESDSATEDVGDGAGTLQAQHALAVGFGAPIPGRHWPRMQLRDRAPSASYWPLGAQLRNLYP